MKQEKSDYQLYHKDFSSAMQESLMISSMQLQRKEDTQSIKMISTTKLQQVQENLLAVKQIVIS